MLEKHLWKSDILSKDAGLLSINGTLIENGLIYTVIHTSQLRRIVWGSHTVELLKML